MTRDEAVRIWQEGARKELHAAELLAEGGEYEAALFHCHLTVEKALKGCFTEGQDADPPYSHDLVRLAVLADIRLNTEQKDWLQELSEFVVGARYWDPDWAKEKATQQNARLWLERTTILLRTFLS